jgi:spore coat protein U-like protein
MTARPLLACTVVAFALLATTEAAAYTGCAVSAATLNFGVYDPTSGSNKSASATFTVSCVKQAGDANFNYRILSSVGSGTFTTRTMSNGSDALNWNVYTDAAWTTVWGDGTAPSTFLSGTLNLAAAATGATVSNSHTVYGLITAGQDLSAGSYAPSTITITWRTQGGGPPTTVATGSLGIVNTINPVCAVTANSTLAFGTYDPTSGTPKDATTTISFKCTKNGIFDIGLGGTVGARTMATAGPPADTLGYELYSNAGRTVAWGNSQDINTVNADDASSSAGVGITTGATAQSRTVYGRIAAGQDSTPGSYSGSVIITIYY